MIGKNRLFLLVFCLGLSFSLAACSKKQVKKTEVPTEEVVETPEVETNELDVHGKDFVEAPEVAAIYFDYDSSSLGADARAVLSRNAEFLKKNPDLQILSEGHCDERGTISYNLTLGQLRAATVRQYYISLGLPEARIGTLSFGKEKPACTESNEGCWGKNRRVATKVRAPKMAADDKDKKEEKKAEEGVKP